MALAASIGSASLKRLASGRSARSAASLALHFLGARALSAGTLLVAAAMLNVAVFADLGVYLALLNLAWMAVFLRYDAAIVAAGSEAQADRAVQLCAAIGLSALGAAAIVAFAVTAAGLVEATIAALFVAALAARAALRLGAMTATRSGHFRTIGRIALVQAVIQPAVLLGSLQLLSDGFMDLVLADALGHAAAAAYIVSRQRASLARALRASWSWDHLRRTAQDWASLPTLNLPGTLTALAFAAAPLLVMPFVASATVAGQIALAVRLFDVPTQIIGAAASPVLLNRMRVAGALFTRPLMLLLAVGVLGLYGSAAFGLVVPQMLFDMRLVADLAAVALPVALFQAGVALTIPLSEGCALYRKQQTLALIHGGALVGCAATIAVALTLGPMAGLGLLAVLSLARAGLVGELLRARSCEGAGLQAPSPFRFA